jgi:hypothetical protein
MVTLQHHPQENAPKRRFWQRRPKPKPEPYSDAWAATADLDELTRRLASAVKEDRAAAARALRRFQPEAFDLLLPALHDKELEVRLAAVESLGELGDERAIQPLITAMRGCFDGRSARDHRTIGILLVVGIAVAFLAFSIGLGALGVGGAAGAMANMVMTVVRGVYVQRRERGKMVGAISQALTKIGERSPRAELSAVVDDLKAVAGDVLQQNKETRESSRQAAARLEALTERIKALPLTSVSPGTDAKVLPTPSTAPEADQAVLPRVL